MSSKTGCFWCACPGYEFVDYRACPVCMANFIRGTWVIEAVDEPTFPDQTPITQSFYPTGRWVVIERRPELPPHVVASPEEFAEFAGTRPAEAPH
jgi:hypothetical protein